MHEGLGGEYRTEYNPNWCPACGDYGVLRSIDLALQELGLKHEKIVVVSGIGCNGRFPQNFKTYGFHTLHGRVLPIVQGIHIANPELCVIGIAGDGDAFAIGGGHVPHAARRNPDITYIVLDNGIYGQTKGQPSPTTEIGFRTKATPHGNQEDPLDISRLSLAYGVSFLARGFPGKTNHLAHLIAEGTRHKGFALIHVLNPCPTYHDTWKEYQSKVVEIGSEHDPTDADTAFALVKEQARIPIGIIFKQNRPTLVDRLGTSHEKLDMKQLLETYR
jgi:2-oxoglutarate/2-oxoacid ferredoxin oxidoreductase subunit beta